MSLANWADSAFFGFQGRIRKGLAAHETRELDTMILSYALANQQYFEDIVNIDSIKQSVQRPVYGYQFNRVTTAVGSAMTTFPTGSLGTTVQVPLTFVTFTIPFATYNVSGYDNVDDFARIFDNVAAQHMRQMRTAIRQWMTNNIYINRTTVLPFVNTNIVNANFNAATDCWEIPGANPFAVMQSVMQQAGYGSSTYDALFDPKLWIQYLNSQAQGVGNATNLAWQFAKNPTMPDAGGYFDNIWQDLNIGGNVPIEPAYTNGTALVMPKNAFAMVPWMPYMYYDPKRNTSFDQYTGGYGTIGDDKYDMTYQLFGWNNQYDSSGGYGVAQGQMQNWQLGWTAAFVPAFFSNTGESAIYQFAITP
jgi:hypothetical protein